MRLAVLATLLAVVGCRGENRPSGTAQQRPPAPTPADPALEPADAAAPDATVAPASLEEGLANLRAVGLAQSAAAIERRVAQRKPKMRLTAEQGLAATVALLELGDRESFRELHDVMPRSTVELARAVAERGVATDDAVEIAEYLIRFVEVLDFQRLEVFDENHSHVIGRHWKQIDYSGEGMTWQTQRNYWAPRGVESFRKAEYIHAYFAGAERLPHWRRVYRPRGRVDNVSKPE